MNGFNFTMTYHHASDVPMRFGKVSPLTDPPRKNWKHVTKSKYRDALWISSNCFTRSKREDYVKILQKYINVDVFGKCSADRKEWNCGRRLVHDGCFNVLNEYKFYLAFEHSFCEDYLTDTFFENYDYDVIIVTLGGSSRNNTRTVLDGAVFIDADNFTSVEELGLYLQELGRDVSRYSSLLEMKSNTTAVPFHQLYQESLCALCEKVHSMSSSESTYYADLREFYREDKYCRRPEELVDKACEASPTNQQDVDTAQQRHQEVIHVDTSNELNLEKFPEQSDGLVREAEIKDNTVANRSSVL